MKTRTIILSGQDDKNNYTAVLSLSGENDLFCDLKAYNLPDNNLYNIILKVGDRYYMGSNVNLGINYHFLFNKANIDNEISVIVLDSGQNNLYLKNNIADEIVNELKQYNINADGNKKTVQTNSYQDLKQESDLKEDGNFFDAIKEQFDDMLKNNPECIEVENLIANSKWVSIQEENDNNTHYILGKIFDENNSVKYVCYGVPASNKNDVVGVDENLSQWLPLNPEDENSAGYYIMYQDANTGETVKI